MQEKSRTHVAIIGAGPAGVAAAVSLQQNGIAFALFEKGATPFASLRRIDPEMELLSPARFNRLPIMQRSTSASYENFREYISSLESYIAHNHVNVKTQTRIMRVSVSGEGFTLEAANGEMFDATHVINATGIIQSPRLPSNFRGEEVSFRWKHSIDVRASDVRDVKKLLVIGGGASAAEVLDRWLEVRRDNAHAMLSLREKLKAFTNPIFGLDIHYWIWLHEHLPASLLGERAYAIPEYMNGTHVLPAIKRGLISCVDEVAEYRGHTVVLNSGATLNPDFVVFATGFTYATKHLSALLEYNADGQPRMRNCESTTTRNLFFLGFKFGRTFASPYLRGIARDAQYVARRIGGG